jgi:hypothetical protein
MEHREHRGFTEDSEEGEAELASGITWKDEPKGEEGKEKRRKVRNADRFVHVGQGIICGPTSLSSSSFAFPSLPPS